MGVLTFVTGIVFFAYDRIIGRQKENARLEAAAESAKNKATFELQEVKRQFTEELQALRERWREEDIAISRALEGKLANLAAIVNDTRDKVLIVETKVGPFWKMIESAVLPRVNVPENLNPVTEEQRRAMSNYVRLKENTSHADLYMAREGFALEIKENKSLDPTTFLFYSLAYGSANARITDLEHEGGR